VFCRGGSGLTNCSLGCATIKTFGIQKENKAYSPLGTHAGRAEKEKREKYYLKGGGCDVVLMTLNVTLRYGLSELVCRVVLKLTGYVLRCNLKPAC